MHLYMHRDQQYSIENKIRNHGINGYMGIEGNELSEFYAR
jgi:hypothetical protein